MTKSDLDAMSLDDLRRYVLTHRADIEAFHLYVDRSKASGRMITIDPDDPNWETALEKRLKQSASDE